MQNICLVKFYNDSLVAYFLEFFLCVENINLISSVFCLTSQFIAD